MIKRIPLLILALILFFSYDCRSQISMVNFSSGYSEPVDIKNCGDQRMFIVEQIGRIIICDTNGVKNSTPFLDIQTRVQYGSEQGLLGLAFAPDYQTSRYYYVYYIDEFSLDTRISRFRTDSLNPDYTDAATEDTIMEIYQPYSNHNGGHIAFGSDGYLYIGMGDGGSGGDPENRSQNPDSLLGKMLRISVDPSNPTYSIPPSNPFANDSTLGAPEIYALGVRNPWRFSFDPLTDDLWIGDVGQNQREEIDFQPGGDHPGWNYGWKCYEGKRLYDTTGCVPLSELISPVHDYTHANGRCSVTGGYVYRGAKFQTLYGKYFYADYCNSELQYLVPNGSGGFTNTNLGSLGASSVSSFGTDYKGELYCSGVNNGTIYKIVSADCTPVATINIGRDTIDDCSTTNVFLMVPFDSSFDYTWTYNGDTISVNSSVVATQEGNYYVHVANQSCSNTDSVFVDFTSPLNVTFSGLDTLYCVNHSPVNLLPNYLGGTFFGPGITGATFHPSIAGVGSWVITYEYTNSRGCTYYHSQDVRIDACSGISENVGFKSMSIFPNPSSNGEFNINYFSQVENLINIKILDMAGRIIYSQDMILNSGSNTTAVKTDLAKGIYIVRFSDFENSLSTKLIIQQ